MHPYATGLHELVFGLSLRKKVALYRNLATSVSAGLDISRAIELAASELSDAVRRDMLESLAEGMPLHVVWNRYPAYFGAFEAAMLQAGELSGDLDGILLDLANMYELELQRYNSIRAQMAYPLLLIHAAVLIPTIPYLVKSCCSTYFLVVGCILGTLYFFAFLAWAMRRLARLNDSVGLFNCSFANIIPVWGQMRLMEAQGHFMECFARLIDSGILADQSLAIAAASCGNVAFAGRISNLPEQITKGVKVSSALAESKLFTAHIVAMISTGEESGQLGPMAAKAANYLLDEAETQRKRFWSLLPVFLLICIGFFVGFQVISSFEEYTKALHNIM